MKKFIILLMLLFTACAPVDGSKYAIEMHHPVAEQSYTYVTAELSMVGVYVDSSVHPDWEIERGIELWNDALPCDHFYLSNYPSALVAITEVELDQNWWGEYDTYTYDIRLNSHWSRHWIVPAHELGHALGAPDMDTPEDLMFIGGTDDPLPTRITNRDLESINEDLLSCP